MLEKLRSFALTITSDNNQTLQILKESTLERIRKIQYARN